MGTAFLLDRLFPFFLLMWRKWAWGDGALWELGGFMLGCPAFCWVGLERG